jgi:hypothetical protein
MFLDEARSLSAILGYSLWDSNPKTKTACQVSSSSSSSSSSTTTTALASSQPSEDNLRDVNTQAALNVYSPNNDCNIHMDSSTFTPTLLSSAWRVGGSVVKGAMHPSAPLTQNNLLIESCAMTISYGGDDGVISLWGDDLHAASRPVSVGSNQMGPKDTVTNNGGATQSLGRISTCIYARRLPSIEKECVGVPWVCTGPYGDLATALKVGHCVRIHLPREPSSYCVVTEINPANTREEFDFAMWCQDEQREFDISLKVLEMFNGKGKGARVFSGWVHNIRERDHVDDKPPQFVFLE